MIEDIPLMLVNFQEFSLDTEMILFLWLTYLSNDFVFVDMELIEAFRNFSVVNVAAFVTSCTQ